MKTKRIIYVDTNPRLYSFMIHSFQNHFIFPLQIRTCSSIICFQIVILGRPMCPSLFWLGAVQHVTRIQALSFGVVIFTIIAPAKLKYSFFFIRDFLDVLMNVKYLSKYFYVSKIAFRYHYQAKRSINNHPGFVWVKAPLEGLR